ncbi:MAG: T9SS type A sorting domain-containing protein, partial [Ignavibacteria bacterium]|nr:T9SS type A sorting domain-containing protein [Ignavibacteria bacterium]
TTAPADYDIDGDLDIVVLGYYVVYHISVEEKLVLVRNEGPAGTTEWEFSYIDLPLGSLTSGASDLAWGDHDGDGDLDLVVGTDGETVIYENEDGTLVLTDTPLPGYWEDNDQADFDLRSITWADYDNDGDLDLLLPSVFDETTFSYSTVLMRNDGPDGAGGVTFTETDSVFAPTRHAQSAWADYDGDQDLDLLLVNIAPLTDEGFIRRYTNEGSGVFTAEDILGYLSVEHGEVQWGDYDGDGDLDVLVAGNVRETDSTYTWMALRVYRNDEEIYTRIDVIDCIPCEGWFDLTAATWADYDSDGDIDILLAGTYNSGSQIEGRARVYTNDGTGLFTVSDSELPAPRASGTRGGTFSWFDIDGDGDLDYFIAGQYFVPGGNGLVEAQMHVYRNDVESINNAPSMPAGLNVVIGTDSSVTFSWLPATDDHTPSAAITYDLNIFRDGVPVALPRRTPEPGSVSAVTEWMLSGLPEGYYEWTLTAVDASYSGSQKASGQFTVGGATGVDSDMIPLVYALEQNYPNPFNPTTTIRYDLPERAHVGLTVYNLNGELVTTLVDEERPAGIHKVVWDARSLATGTYFIRLSTTAFVKTQKVILLK